MVLDEAAKLFPTEWSIHYNLACYCAQPGQPDAAREHLGKSYELGDAKQIKLMALDDEDLKPLWEGKANFGGAFVGRAVHANLNRFACRLAMKSDF